MRIAANEGELAALASALAGSDQEREPQRGGRPCPEVADRVRAAITDGGDPLGAAFCSLRPAHIRRRDGAVYTPEPIVRSMVAWARDQGVPDRIVDPGAGSGRFLFAAGRAFPDAALVAVELDPLAALILRANAEVRGIAHRLTLHVTDYRSVSIPDMEGRTLFIGNPPYVRHHDIEPEWKEWLRGAAGAYGLRASALAGLHIHFLLRTRQLARPGDFGAFITSSEWLDTNYGALPRKLLMDGLGGSALHVIDPAAMPFGDVAATGAITCFRAGGPPSAMRLRKVGTLAGLGRLEGGRPVLRARLEAADRWSPLLRPRRRRPEGMVELGELCRVHRGQVTGCNAVWLEGSYPGPLPRNVLVPAVTRAKELIGAAGSLSSVAGLRRVIELPSRLDELDGEDFARIRRFLSWATAQGADRSYIASHRRPWWRVGLREPAPILCTYMARRPPAFVRNRCGARHLNIAHGLYPRERMSAEALDMLAAWLGNNVPLGAGRTYAGGLAKFEPREIERLAVPLPGLP